MNKYDVNFTLHTIARHPLHAINRLKVAVREYNETHATDQGMEISGQTFEEIKPTYKVGMGSLFRKNGDLYALVSCGMNNSGGHVLSRLRDGCWSRSGTTAEIVAQMGTDWILVKAGKRFGGQAWTGKVNLEDVSL